MARTVHSAKDKATEALALTQRKVDRIVAALDKANSEREGLVIELAKARVERDYAAKHPALAPQDDTPSP